MDSKVKSAVNELADLFGTTPKGTTVYFNEYNYTPIPQPVTEAVKAIMNDYSELKYRLGLYSVTVLDTDKKKIANALNKKPIESKTAMGNLHDEFVTGKITEAELKDTLTKKHGYGKRKAAELIDKWKPGVIKSSISKEQYFDMVRQHKATHASTPEFRKQELNALSEFPIGTKFAFKEDNSWHDVNTVYEKINTNSWNIISIINGNIEDKYNQTDDGVRIAVSDEFGSDARPTTYVSGYGSINSSVIKSSLSDYFPVSGSQAEELEDKISQFDNKSDIRTTLEDYFHIYDDYAEMSVEEFDNALDGYFNELDEDEFYSDEIDDVPMDDYDGDEYSESLE